MTRLLRGSLAAVGAGAVLLAVSPAAFADDYTGSSDPGVQFSVPDEVTVGEPIHISGTGWKAPSGAGSVLGVKLDDGGVSTTLDVKNPVDGKVQGNKTIYAIVAADASGAWSIDVPFPTEDNAVIPDGQPWTAGTEHNVRFLTGSLLPGDKGRTEAASFTLIPPLPGDPDPNPGSGTSPDKTPPTWAKQTLISGNAVAWVGKEVAAGDKGVIRLKGYGWTTKDGAGSTIAVKLNKSQTDQYTRAGSQVKENDPTIWAMLTAKTDGTFETDIPAPTGLKAGQYLTVRLASGKFGANDVQRQVISDPLVVGGKPYAEGGTQPAGTCTPSVKTATASVQVVQAGLGGTLRLTGKGWCATPGKGGSTIGVKIDDGAYSHLTPAVSSNLTTWQIVQADAKTGDFSVVVQLPDGTTKGAKGSTPAFPTGAHTLRLLSGSLKPGDQVRTVQTNEFVVGAYRPVGLPDPLEYREDLRAGAWKGLAALRTGDKLVVRVAGATKGSWVFLSAYSTDGSPWYPWGETWRRTDANGQVVIPLHASKFPTGQVKLVAQWGDQGRVGTLAGWTSLTVRTPQATPSASSTPAAPVTRTVTVTAPAPAPVPVAVPTPAASTTATTPAPTDHPAAPFEDDAGFTDDNAGDVSAAQSGSTVTLSVGGKAKPGDWVYLYAYSTPTPIGWAQLDDKRQVVVDVATLPFGEHRIAVVDTTGVLIGWAPATGTSPLAEASATGQSTGGITVPGAPTGSASQASQASRASRAQALGGGWWLLGGALALIVGGGTGVGVALFGRRRPGAPAEEVTA